MKVLPFVLGASLVANAGFLVLGSGPLALERRGSAQGASSENFTGAGTPALVGTVESSPTSRLLGEVLRPGNEERLRDQLRAAGLDEQMVRSVVSSLIWSRYESRFKALQPAQANPDWWKDDGDWWGGQTKEQRAQMKALQAEVKAETLRLLGREAEGAGAGSWLARQYGYLPAEKREALQQIEQDYNELGNELRQETQGFSIPSDVEKTRFLQEEKKRDLAALLSPQELEAYELRQSGTSRNLRWQMAQMDATEAEFKAIFEIKRDFDEQYSEYDSYGNKVRKPKSEDWKVRSEAEKAMKAQLKAALGDERYAEYLRAGDNDYRQLRAATKRFALPADTPSKIYALRNEVPSAALKIADDAALTPEQKKTGLAKLAVDSRNRVKAILGAEVAQAYFDQNGMQWLQQMEKGTIITFDAEGGQTHRRIDQVTKPKPTEPKAK